MLETKILYNNSEGNYLDTLQLLLDEEFQINKTSYHDFKSPF